MDLENEITLKINCSYEKLHSDIINKGFEIINKIKLFDICFVDCNKEVLKENIRDVLKKYVLVRTIGESKHTLTYKYKDYSQNGDILSQRKEECQIIDVESGINFMNAIRI